MMQKNIYLQIVIITLSFILGICSILIGKMVALCISLLLLGATIVSVVYIIVYYSSRKKQPEKPTTAKRKKK